ncbi:MAG TPA: hypothetical protein VLD17_02495 [Gemmatimonadaceae bacterium]|nr:hypothetical protein [Gemmatimonadaceae bacterium]
MTAPTPNFDDVSVAAILAQRSREDRSELLDDLVAMLSEVVPGCKVERGLIRRRVTGIRLPVGTTVFALQRGANDAYEASRQQLVRGVVIRTDPLEIDDFLTELGTALDAELKRTERGREAIRSWLNANNP